MPSKKCKPIVISIDGPAGAGKSTVSKMLAIALGGRLLDTGAMYRAVAYLSLRRKSKTEKEIEKIALELEFDVHPKTQAMLVFGKDFALKLRTPKVSQKASEISSFKSVRSVLTKKQRQLGRGLSKKYPVVVEGRDIGTVVFPKVEFKFYVTADPKVRATRRFHQLRGQGNSKITLKKIIKQNNKRDTQDSTRKHAPLKCPDDAIVVDTSSQGATQVVKFMVDHIKGKSALTK